MITCIDTHLMAIFVVAGFTTNDGLEEKRTCESSSAVVHRILRENFRLPPIENVFIVAAAVINKVGQKNAIYLLSVQVSQLTRSEDFKQPQLH